ncbi:restriction endonuclease subunit S, partial [Campylobacter jejuni]
MQNNIMTNLPQGWKMETLGEILSSDKYSIKRGPFGSALKKSFFVEKGIRIFEQYNPINNDPHWKRYFISHEKFQELEAFKATEGDLLISCSGTLGKIVELPKDTEMGIINQALLKIRLNNIKILNSYFIYYFNSPIMQEKILESTLGSTIKN